MVKSGKNQDFFIHNFNDLSIEILLEHDLHGVFRNWLSPWVEQEDIAEGARAKVYIQRLVESEKRFGCLREVCLYLLEKFRMLGNLLVVLSFYEALRPKDADLVDASKALFLSRVLYLSF